jgi:hypothetical protein
LGLFDFIETIVEKMAEGAGSVIMTADEATNGRVLDAFIDAKDKADSALHAAMAATSRAVDTLEAVCTGQQKETGEDGGDTFRHGEEATGDLTSQWGLEQAANLPTQDFSRIITIEVTD